MRRDTREGTPGRVVRALATFGLSMAEVRRARSAFERSCATTAARVAVRAPRVTVVAGPSGSGKSTVLRAVERAIERRGGAIVRVERSEAWNGEAWQGRAIVMIPGTTLPEALGLLARVGLAEARLFGLTPSELSDGQKARFAIALAMKRATDCAIERGSAWVLADEFASGLDEVTARGVARSTARMTNREARLHVVACTCEERMAAWMEADATVRTRLDGRPRLSAKRIETAGCGGVESTDASSNPDADGGTGGRAA